MPALLRVRRSGTRIVFTGTMTATLPSNRARRALRRLRFITPLRFVDAVVTSTDVMRQYFLGLGGKGEIEVIPNGVDLGIFHPPVDGAERLAVRRSLGIGPEESMLLYVGAVTPRKGIELLLEAWVRHVQRHPNSHLVLAGPERTRFDPAHAEYHARLEGLREASGAPERVHYLGVVENIPELMRAADVFVFASRREGMGNVVLEAMASELPVVLTPFIGLAGELGRPDVDYLLAEPDADSIASCISRLTVDPELRDRIARSGRAWVEGHMDVERSVARYAELYRRLATQEDGSQNYMRT